MKIFKAFTIYGHGGHLQDLSCDLGHLYKVSFPLLTDLNSINEANKKRFLKIVDGWLTDTPLVYYVLT